MTTSQPRTTRLTPRCCKMHTDPARVRTNEWKIVVDFIALSCSLCRTSGANLAQQAKSDIVCQNDRPSGCSDLPPALHHCPTGLSGLASSPIMAKRSDEGDLARRAFLLRPAIGRVGRWIFVNGVNHTGC